VQRWSNLLYQANARWISVDGKQCCRILSFTWRWNDYLWPLIVINNQQAYTLQLLLANLIGTNTVEWGRCWLTQPWRWFLS
jgi:hypothetical protein